jgi:acyl-CoA thioester hydrolase
MAVLRSVFVYLRPALRGEKILVATWLLPSEGKLKIRRRFQMWRTTDAQTVLRAEIDYVCLELSSGRPIRWPPEFRERYLIDDEVRAALPTLAPL